MRELFFLRILYLKFKKPLVYSNVRTKCLRSGDYMKYSRILLLL